MIKNKKNKNNQNLRCFPGFSDIYKTFSGLEKQNQIPDFSQNSIPAQVPCKQVGVLHLFPTLISDDSWDQMRISNEKEVSKRS